MRSIHGCGEREINLLPSFSVSKVLHMAPGWYRGDFHAHTNFSDGYYAPPRLVDVAKAEQLDFFAITDHNTIEAFSHFGAESGMLVIPGVELTFKEGHFNVFGVEGPLAWMEELRVGRHRLQLGGEYATIGDLVRQAASQGLLTSINHPLLQPWEWQDLTTDLRYVHCLEIWNDPSWPDNKEANPRTVALWTAMLNDGYRITALGGSDYHRPEPKPGQNKPCERLGLPSTYVYSAEFSGSAILAAVRQRRAYVSMDPQVAFQAYVNGTTYDIGADLGPLSGAIEFVASVSQCPMPALAKLVRNGEIITEVQVEKNDVSLRWNANGDTHDSAWYRLDVVDQQGQMLAITNPIFVGPRREPSLHRYGDFVSLL
jgi:hypothetical protein